MVDDSRNLTRRSIHGFAHRGRDLYCLCYLARFERQINSESAVCGQGDAGLLGLLEAFADRGNRVCSHRQIGRRIESVFVRAGGAHEVRRQISYGDSGVWNSRAIRVFHRARDAAEDRLTWCADSGAND